MKKVIVAFIVIIGTFFSIGFISRAEVYTGSFGVNVNYSLDTTSGVLTISGTGEMKSNYPYTVIPWKSLKESITEVVIEDGVIGEIERNLFYNYNNLTSVTIGNGVTVIGSSAFGWCSELTSVEIGAGVTNIGEYAFANCRLRNLQVGDGVKNIGKSAFAGCEGLQYLYYQGELSQWLEISFNDGEANPMWCADYIFINGENKAQITIPDGTKSIGDYAFFGSEIRKVIIPDSVGSIGAEAFENCTRLASIEIGKGVTSIGMAAFSGDTRLTDVYYAGSEEDWNNINIGYFNDDLTEATIHYNCNDEENIGEVKIEYTVSENSINVECKNLEQGNKVYAAMFMSGAEKIVQVVLTDEKGVVNLEEGTEKVKIFLWESIKRMEPLCEAATITFE